MTNNLTESMMALVDRTDYPADDIAKYFFLDAVYRAHLNAAQNPKDGFLQAISASMAWAQAIVERAYQERWTPGWNWYGKPKPLEEDKR
jgi:hypothetical protein